MFTGLIEDVGTIKAVEPIDGGLRVTVDTRLANELALGDSITIGGVTNSIPSATVVSHERKKSKSPLASTVAMPALKKLAVSAPTQKLPTERGTMKDRIARSRRLISHCASSPSSPLASVKAAHR